MTTPTPTQTIVLITGVTQGIGLEVRQTALRLTLHYATRLEAQGWKVNASCPDLTATGFSGGDCGPVGDVGGGGGGGCAVVGDH